MEDAEDYVREPCAELYFKAKSAMEMLKYLPEEKRERIFSMYSVTQEDVIWQKSQAPIESYWDEETRTGDWGRVSRSWDRVRASYNEYKGITPAADEGS